jgi:hypothetical protein
MQKVVFALLYFRSSVFFLHPQNMLQSSKNYQAFAVVDDFAILRGYSWTYIGTKSLKSDKRFSTSGFFMNQCPTGPQVFHWGRFEFFRIRGDIRELIFIAGVNDTAD